MVKLVLYNALNRVLRKGGFVLIPAREARDRDHLVKNYGLRNKDVIRLNATPKGGLRQHLIANQQTKWLEIGCGGTLEQDFHYIDLFPEGVVDRSFQGRYSRIDIVHAGESQLQKLGKFDLVRMQHVFEHFAPEDGREVLRRCASLLNPRGYLLITTPDLRIFAKTYLNDGFKGNPQMESFNREAVKNGRANAESPDSFYFSVFAHSLLHERHLWCYDFDGLKYLLEETGSFEDIQELGLDHPLTDFPFTHNRPEEDVCVLARKV